MEGTFGRKASKTHSPPSPSVSEAFELGLTSAIMGLVFPAGPDDTILKFSASVTMHEKVLVAALITSVQETLKMDTSGAVDKVAIPFGMPKKLSPLRFFLTPQILIHLFTKSMIVRSTPLGSQSIFR